MTIFDWFQRRNYRKFIKQTFKTTRCFIEDCSLNYCIEIIAALQKLLDDYANKYDKDDIYLHYLGRLEYFKLIKRWKEQDELLRRKIEK